LGEQKQNHDCLIDLSSKKDGVGFADPMGMKQDKPFLCGKSGPLFAPPIWGAKTMASESLTPRTGNRALIV
jgi:hypothetical protein